MVPCGPADADELARSARSRVYEVRGEAYACHHGRRRIVLGESGRIVHVYLGGRFAGVRRSEVYGESLRIYDLRARKPQGVKARVRRFVTIRFASTGIAAYIAESLRGGQVLEDTAGWDYGSVSTTSLAFRGTVLALRGDDGYGLVGLDTESEPAPNGRLLTEGRIRIDVHGDQLFARRGGERPLDLGQALTDCLSPEGCFGVARLHLRSDRFVATRYISASMGGQPDRFTIYDLDTRRSRQPCSNVAAVVLTDAGRIACGQWGASSRILSEGTVLDDGPDVDPYSLHRRGDQLVWLRGGVERTAPLP